MPTQKTKTPKIQGPREFILDFSEVLYRGTDGVLRKAYGTYVRLYGDTCVTVSDPQQHAPGEFWACAMIPVAHVTHAERITREQYETKLRGLIEQGHESQITPQGQAFVDRVKAEGRAQAAVLPPNRSSFGGSRAARYGAPPAPSEES